MEGPSCSSERVHEYEIRESVFHDNNMVGKKIWQEMNKQCQVKNLMYVCRLLTVAKYCKKEKVLLKDANFITAMNAIYQWFQDKQYSEMTVVNCVKVTENSLTVFDARGTSTRYTNYFLDRLHEIRNHSKGIFCQESQGAQRLVGPRVISCISKKYAMENTYDLAEDMLQKDDSFESDKNNSLDEESEKLQEEEEEEGGALTGT
eukprot:scaffold33268_cov31-Attheya_sp.AAC.1